MFRKYWERLKAWYLLGFSSHVKCQWVRWEEVQEGYIDTATVLEQSFIRVCLWYGIPYKNEVLFKERVPSFAWIQQACLGYTDWKSDAPQWMHDAHRAYMKSKEKPCKV